jgi:hypothetical protein
MQETSRASGVIALLVFGCWVLATWLLEGRIETLLRPEAKVARALYAVVANILTGILFGLVALRILIQQGLLKRERAGFGASVPRIGWMVAAFGLGAGFYAFRGAPTWHPVVFVNAYLQVWVVSSAEIIVCWALIGTTIEAFLKPLGQFASLCIAALVASALFGIYHFAHSAPFNTLPMVLLRDAVGLVTSVFFFVSRDAYATIVFHNFLGVFGVIQALAAAQLLDVFSTVQLPILLIGICSIVVIGVADRFIIRHGALDT